MANIGNAIAGVGSALGLPEFGISELFGSTQPKVFGNAPYGFQPTQNQSNYIAANPAVSSPSFSGPLNPNPQPTTVKQTTGGGGTTGGQVLGASTFSAPQSNPQGANTNDLLNQINGQFDPTINYLNQAADVSNQSYQGAQNDINNQYGVGVSNINNQFASGNQQLDTSATQAGQRKEDAQNAASRLYNDMLLGYKQRFGSGSSAGQGASELLGRETQSQFGNIQKSYSDAMGQITSLKSDLTNKTNLALQTLQSQKDQYLNSARDQFNAQMNQINQNKAQAESDKATARLDLLQQLRNQVNAINLQDLQFKQQLAAAHQGYASQIDQYTQQVLQNITGGNTALQGLQNNTTTNPTSPLAIGGAQTSGVSTGPAPVGYANPLATKKDQYDNSIA